MPPPNGSLGIANDLHHLHLVSLQYFSLLDSLVEGESVPPQFGVKDLDSSSAQVQRRDLHSSLCWHSAVAPTRLLSERDPSVDHIQTPTSTFASFTLAHHCPSLWAAAASSSMTVLTTESLTVRPGAASSCL